MVYYNPDSFQIICAGRDGYFGGGPFWTPGRPNAEGSPGYDDMTAVRRDDETMRALDSAPAAVADDYVLL
jgi:hypothetical protein